MFSGGLGECLGAGSFSLGAFLWVPQRACITRDVPPAVPTWAKHPLAGTHNTPSAPVTGGPPNMKSSGRITCTFLIIPPHPNPLGAGS